MCILRIHGHAHPIASNSQARVISGVRNYPSWCTFTVGSSLARSMWSQPMDPLISATPTTTSIGPSPRTYSLSHLGRSFSRAVIRFAAWPTHGVRHNGLLLVPQPFETHHVLAPTFELDLLLPCPHGSMVDTHYRRMPHCTSPNNVLRKTYRLGPALVLMFRSSLLVRAAQSQWFARFVAISRA